MQNNHPLAELVMVCAKRQDVLLQIFDGFVSVYIGSGPARATMIANCEDEKAVIGLIQILKAENSTKNPAAKAA